MDLKLKKQFRGETDLDVFVWGENNNVAFTEAYVEWLEKQCTINGVGCSVWMVQDINTRVVNGMFTAQAKAIKFVNGSKNMAITNLTLG